MSKKCLLCGSRLPNRVLIDGKVKNICNRKYCLDCSPFGKHNTRKLDSKYQTTIFGDKILCAKCNELKPLCNNSKGRFCGNCCKKRASDKRVIKERELKKYLVDIKGGKCCLCGYNKNKWALEFHHIDPNIKSFAFSEKRVYSDKLFSELEKCICVCVNCHRKQHEKEMPKFIVPTENPKYYDIKKHNDFSKEKFICACCEYTKSKQEMNNEYKSKISVCKICSSAIAVNSQRRSKQEYVDYLGGKCLICGLFEPLICLEFHHLNSKEKKFSIASKKWKILNEEIKSELKKCVLLCGNCHREEHASKFK